MHKFRIVLLGFSLSIVWAALAIAQPPYPENYPAVFPQHESCRMVQVMDMQNNKTAILECGQTPVEDVYNFYLNRAQGDSWEVVMENKSPEYMLFMVEKDGLAMQVQVINENGATQLALSLVPTD